MFLVANFLYPAGLRQICSMRSVSHGMKGLSRVSTAQLERVANLELTLVFFLKISSLCRSSYRSYSIHGPISLKLRSSLEILLGNGVGRCFMNLVRLSRTASERNQSYRAIFVLTLARTLVVAQPASPDETTGYYPCRRAFPRKPR